MSMRMKIKWRYKIMCTGRDRCIVSLPLLWWLGPPAWLSAAFGCANFPLACAHKHSGYLTMLSQNRRRGLKVQRHYEQLHFRWAYRTCITSFGSLGRFWWIVCCSLCGNTADRTFRFLWFFSFLSLQAVFLSWLKMMQSGVKKHLTAPPLSKPVVIRHDPFTGKVVIMKQVLRKQHYIYYSYVVVFHSEVACVPSALTSSGWSAVALRSSACSLESTSWWIIFSRARRHTLSFTTWRQTQRGGRRGQWKMWLFKTYRCFILCVYWLCVFICLYLYKLLQQRLQVFPYSLASAELQVAKSLGIETHLGGCRVF